MKIVDYCEKEFWRTKMIAYKMDGQIYQQIVMHEIWNDMTRQRFGAVDIIQEGMGRLISNENQKRRRRS